MVWKLHWFMGIRIQYGEGADDCYGGKEREGK